jgi:hypothetical protein
LNAARSAVAVGRSVPRVSSVLGALRLADVVRYDSDGKRNYYRLKHPREIRQVLAALSRLVEAASKVAPATASHSVIFTFSELRKHGSSLRTQIQTIITRKLMMGLGRSLPVQDRSQSLEPDGLVRNCGPTPTD